MSRSLTLPTLGEGIASATVVEILVKPGDTVATEQAVMSLETDKAQFELPTTMAGVVEQILVAVGDEVAIGQPVLRLAGGEAPTEAAPTPTPTPTPAPPPAVAKPVPAAAGPAPTQAPTSSPAASVPIDRGAAVGAAPSVRRLARERGIDLAEIAARTGRSRVTAGDVEAHAVARAPGGSTAGPGTVEAPALPDFTAWGEIDIEPMSKIRRKTAENMARAWIEIPTVTHHDEADITALEALRKRYAPRVKEAGGSLTWTAILLHVLAGALKRFPKLNASVDMAGHRIIYKKYVHIGVAVDTERGLLVPVLRAVDTKNISQIAGELAVVSEAARSRNIKPDLMQGATFTLTNLGGVGGVSFNPIVNPPQVAILGVSRARTTAVWKDEAFVPRLMLPLAVSYDHRIIDGAEAARFLRWVCEALEEPFLLDLEGQ